MSLIRMTSQFSRLKEATILLKLVLLKNSRDYKLQQSLSVHHQKHMTRSQNMIQKKKRRQIFRFCLSSKKVKRMLLYSFLRHLMSIDQKST